MQFLRDIKIKFPQLGIEYSKDDLRFDFNIQKKFSTEGNTAHISIYNLRATIKSILAKINLEVVVEAGYVDQGRKVIFIGALKKVEEFLSGPDRIFNIFAIDGGQILERVGTFEFVETTDVAGNVQGMLDIIQNRKLTVTSGRIDNFAATFSEIPDNEAGIRQQIRLGTQVGFVSNNFPANFDQHSWVYPGKFRDALNAYSLNRDYRDGYIWSIQDNNLNIVRFGDELTLSPFIIDSCTPVIGLPRRVDYTVSQARFQERGDNVLTPLTIPDYFTWRITVLCNGDVKPYRTTNVNLEYPVNSIKGSYRILDVTHYGSNWTNNFYTEFEIINFDLEKQLQKIARLGVR